VRAVLLESYSPPRINYPFEREPKARNVETRPNQSPSLLVSPGEGVRVRGNALSPHRQVRGRHESSFYRTTKRKALNDLLCCCNAPPAFAGMTM